MNAALTRDQEEPTPDAYYGAYRYMDRMFEPKRAHRREEIAAIRLDDLSFEVQYLMRHLLILKRQYARTLRDYPNLRGLESPKLKEIIDPPLVLTDPPRHAWSYFRKKNIWL